MGYDDEMLDARDLAILTAMSAAPTAYQTLLELHDLTGIPVPGLADRLPRLERDGYVAHARDGATGARRSYRLTLRGDDAAHGRWKPEQSSAATPRLEWFSKPMRSSIDWADKDTLATLIDRDDQES
ncbi:MAG: hypothetical protein ACRDJN_19270 [Chloroflexota bacterium]